MEGRTFITLQLTPAALQNLIWKMLKFAVNPHGGHIQILLFLILILMREWPMHWPRVVINKIQWEIWYGENVKQIVKVQFETELFGKNCFVSDERDFKV